MSYEAREGEVPPIGESPQVIPPYLGRPQLFIERGADNHLYYWIGDNWWDATTLTLNQVPLGTLQLEYLTDINPEDYRSQPVYLQFENDWELLSTDGNRLLVQTGPTDVVSIEEIISPDEDDPINFVQPLLIPDLSQPVPVGGPYPRLQLPLFNPVWMERLTDLADDNSPLYAIDLSPITPQPTLGAAPVLPVSQIFLVVDQQGRPWYQYNGNLYGIQSLLMSEGPMGPVRVVEDLTNFNFRSGLILVQFRNGWSLYQTPGDSAELVASTADETTPVTEIQVVPVPNPHWSGLIGPRRVRLVRRVLPEPHPDVVARFIALQQEGRPLVNGRPVTAHAGFGVNRVTGEPVYLIGQYVYNFSNVDQPLSVPLSQVEYLADFSDQSPILVRMTNGWAILRPAGANFSSVATSPNPQGNVVWYQIGNRYQVGRLGEPAMLPSPVVDRARLDAAIGHPLSDLIGPFISPSLGEIRLAAPVTPPRPFMPTSTPPALTRGQRTRSVLEQSTALPVVQSPRPSEGTPTIQPFRLFGEGLRFGEIEREALEETGLRPVTARIFTGLRGLPPVAPSARRQLVFPEETPETPGEESLHRLSVETLMRQLYGLPVTLPEELIVNRLQTPFVTFDRAVELIQRGQVQRFLLDPLLQPWAGLPTSPNRIITLILNDGTTALVKANFNPTDKSILPPV